jgi:hypothetical protein
MESVKVHDLLGSAVAAITGAPYEGTWNANRRVMVQGVVDGDGAVTATILVQGSNNGQNWETIGTITLDDDDTDSGTVAVDYPWAYLRADLTAITGTDAVAQALLSI